MCKEAHVIETLIDYLMINRYEFPESQECPMDDIAKISSQLGISINCTHTKNKGTENLTITCINGECKIKCLLCGKIIDAKPPTDDELEKVCQQIIPELDDECVTSLVQIIEVWHKWENYMKNRKWDPQKPRRVAFTIRRHAEE